MAILDHPPQRTKPGTPGIPSGASASQATAPEEAMNTGQVLYRRAEAVLRENSVQYTEKSQALLPDAIRQMFHELRVHQIELEMQNEELRQSQEALDASRARYFDLYDLAPVGYCTLNAQGMILQANLCASSLFGVARGTLVKQPISQFIAREDADRFYQHRNKLIERGESPPCELQMVKNDGTPFWAHVEATFAQDDGAPVLHLVISDITKRKQVEERLQLAASVFTHTREGILITSANGTIIDVNDTFVRITGYSRAEAIGKIPRFLKSGCHDDEFYAALWRDLIEQGHWYGEIWNRRKNGEVYTETLTISAVRDANGKTREYVALFSDNTSRKRIEAERALLDQALQDKNAELEEARLVADTANLAKSGFLSSMSHELRTPLTAILLFTQLMESGTPPPTISQKKSIDQILKAVWYLRELINEILDLALIESGKLSLSMEPVALAEVMRECAAMIEPQAHKRSISVEYACFEIPYLVQADRTRLKQVLLNLLSNAIKYNKVDGTVVVECRQSTPGSLRISVRESGEGLAAEQIAQLFQPFNRLGHEAKAGEGSGIGLVICKRLVELMQGKIGVESTVGEGCVFWIELNLATESAATVGLNLPEAFIQFQGHREA